MKGAEPLPARGLRARARALLPEGRGARWLVGASFIDSLGTGLFIAGSALFFTKVLGLSTGQVGIGLTISGIAGLLGTPIIGRLADRIGPKRGLVALYGWRGACFVLYPFADTPVLFYGVAFLVGFAEWSSGPLTQSLVGTISTGERRVRTMAVIGSVRNVGFTGGALLATGAVAAGDPRFYTALVLADALTFLLAAVMLARLPFVGVAPVNAVPAGEDATTSATAAVAMVRDVKFLLLTGLNGILYLHSILLTVGLPLWISTQTSTPLAVVGVVVVVNTVMVILLQVPLSRGVEGLRPSARRQLWAGWLLGACCVLVAFTPDVSATWAVVLVLAAVIAMTLGEIWQSIGAWGISYALSPEHRRSTYLSVYHLGLTGSSVVGPALITFAVIGVGPFGWLGLGAAFVLTGFAVSVVSRRADAPAMAHN
ncbi:MFS transporter [Saccharothrix isguenensis]